MFCILLLAPLLLSLKNLICLFFLLLKKKFKCLLKVAKKVSYYTVEVAFLNQHTEVLGQFFAIRV